MLSDRPFSDLISGVEHIRWVNLVNGDEFVGLLLSNDLVFSLGFYGLYSFFAA